MAHRITYGDANQVPLIPRIRLDGDNRAVRFGELDHRRWVLAVASNGYRFCFAHYGSVITTSYAALACALPWTKPSSSALISCFSVVGMPWGAPLKTLSVAFLMILDDNIALAAIGTT